MEDNKKHLTMQLVEDFCINKKYLDEEYKKIICNFSSDIYNKNIKELYDINECIVENRKLYEGINISYVQQNDQYMIIIDGSIIELKLEQIKEIIRGLIDILDDTLPLGTVVKLKKEYMKKIIKNKEIKDAEFVIVNRFVFHNEVKIFLPYVGIVYPVGFIESAEAFHFTPSLIEEVVHRGYSDEKDYAYTYLIKKELIVEKNMHSFGFASQEEIEKYKEISKVKNYD